MVASAPQPRCRGQRGEELQRYRGSHPRGGTDRLSENTSQSNDSLIQHHHCRKCFISGARELNAMSVNPMGDMTYADHDVHHVLHSVKFRRNADSGPTDALTDEQQYEITERGLDPDELAELRAMRVQAVTFTEPGGANQGNDGAIVAELGAGFNLSDDEFLQNGATTTTVDTDDSGTDDFQIQTKDTDEVGQLWSSQLTGYIQAVDDTNGVGLGGSATQTDVLLDFAELTGGGPVVDSVDDFTSRIRAQIFNSLESVGVRAQYSLYYAVEESEGGRTRFGR